jgi:putative Holliday junction resolvase
MNDNEKKIIGIDYGEKSIGIAIADVRVQIAVPFKIIKTSDLSKENSELDDIFNKLSIEKAIVGLPIDMKGERTDSTKRAEQFANFISKKYNVDVKLWDERLTTKEVKNNLIKRLLKNGDKKASKNAKAKLDALSACLILQSYLEHISDNN